MSNVKNSIKSNIAYNSFYEVLIIIIPLIVSPYISRVLRTEGIGLYSFTFAVANYFKRAAMLGISKYGNRSIALVKEEEGLRRKRFWEIYTIQFISSFTCLLLYGCYLLLFNTRGASSYYQALFVLSSMFDVGWYYFGNEKFKPVIILNAISKLLYLSLTFFFVRKIDDVNKYITIMALSYLIPNVILFANVIIHVKLKITFSLELKESLKGVLLLFIPVIAVTIYKSMDKLMLGIICETAYENGIYENAEKILHVPIAVISAVSTVLMPRMTKLYRDKDNEKADSLMISTVRYAAFIGIASAFGLAGVSEIFSNVYWGAGFEECAVLLTMFAISIPFMSFAEIIRTQYIIPQKHDIIYIVAVCSGAVINFSINLLLIPFLGAEGAVIGTIVAETVVCVYQAYKVTKFLPIRQYVREFIIYLMPGVIMYIFLRLFCTNVHHTIFNLVISVVFGACVYIFFSMVMLRFTHKEQYEHLKGLLIKILKLSRT